MLDPASSLGTITHFGGTLDLSHPRLAPQHSGVLGGRPIHVEHYRGAVRCDRLSELLAVSNLFVNGGDTAIVEVGVGTLQDDGSFLITATRAVTFVGWDGRVLDTETVPLFGAATAPDNRAPDGCRFAGWDRDFSYITQNVTVAARFEAARAHSAACADFPRSRRAAPPPLRPTKTSKYIPVSSKLAATGDAAGNGAGAVANGNGCSNRCPDNSRRRERLGKG